MPTWRENVLNGVADGTCQKGRHACRPLINLGSGLFLIQAGITATILCVRGSKIRISSPTRM
jgi:hypothetical protein